MGVRMYVRAGGDEGEGGVVCDSGKGWGGGCM